jgi:hypothetical protein
MPTARVGVGVGSNGGPGHGAAVVVPGAGAAVLLLRVVALAALVHPQQHRAQALGREPAALQVTGNTGGTQRVSGRSHYSPPNRTGRENLRRKGGCGRGSGRWVRAWVGNGFSMRSYSMAEAPVADGDLRLQLPRRGAGGGGGLADEVWECGKRERERSRE